MHGRFALEHAGKIIDYLSASFGIAYLLSKADFVAIPEFAYNAMEGWGLITGRPTRILIYAQADSDVLAHELAHQWFGNLVTMDWWDELWLNEGFATWAGWAAVAHFRPDWDVWARYQAVEAT